MFFQIVDRVLESVADAEEVIVLEEERQGRVGGTDVLLKIVGEPVKTI